MPTHSREFLNDNFQCSICGDYHPNETVAEVENYRPICSDCFNSGHVQPRTRCSRCNVNVPSETIRDVTADGIPHWVCPSCERQIQECDTCGEPTFSSLTTPTCRSCSDEYNCNLHLHLLSSELPVSPQQWRSISKRCPDQSDVAITYGVELEIDTRADFNNPELPKKRVKFATMLKFLKEYSVENAHHKVIYKNGELDENEFIFIKDDGSLSECGLEIISIPASLKYHFTVIPWDSILSKMRECNFGSARIVQRHGINDITTAGLHIHIDAINFINRSKTGAHVLLYLCERFWEELRIMSRRYEHSFFKWSCPYSILYRGNEIVELKEHDPNFTLERFFNRCYNESNHGTRYRMVNLSPLDDWFTSFPSGTIEMRFWNGTVDPYAFYSSLFIVDVLVQMSFHYAELLDSGRITEDDIFNLIWDDVLDYTMNTYPYIHSILEEGEFVPPEDYSQDPNYLPIHYMMNASRYRTHHKEKFDPVPYPPDNIPEWVFYG